MAIFNVFRQLKGKLSSQKIGIEKSYKQVIRDITTKWNMFLKQETYLTSSYQFKLLKPVQDTLKDIKLPIYLWLDINFCKQIFHKRKFLKQYKKEIEDYNHCFIQKRLDKYKSFFDGKDDHLKYPLDQDQRSAVVKDDKHNLVVAAAGSGKTSVITARIAYLVRRNDAVYKDKILALAFTRVAAREMRERIQKNFSIDIRISTFHSLGRSIIVEDTKKQPQLLYDGEKAGNKYKDKIKELFFSSLYIPKITILLLEYFSILDDTSANFHLSDKDIYIESQALFNNSGFLKWLRNEEESITLESTLEHFINSQKQQLTKRKEDTDYEIGDYNEFLSYLYRLKDDIYEIIKQTSTFITLAKSNFLKPKDIAKRLLTKDYDEKQKLFGKIANGVYINYEKFLRKKGKIDFNDMLNLAIEIIRRNPEKYYNRYDHILVDEFQDISNQRMELIRCFINKNYKTRLFCVGDDWQSIYRFTGSEVEFFVDFEKYFPNPEITHLKRNYRCCKNIVEMSNKLISHNAKQIRKEVIATNQKSQEIMLYEIDNTTGYAERMQIQHACNEILRLIDTRVSEKEIMVISRFKRIGEKLRQKCLAKNIKVFGHKSANFGIRINTAHSSKGSEAKYVFILEAVSGKYGFPCEIEDPKVLEIAKYQEHDDKFDEERRLFYVALTRTKKYLYIYTQKGKRSMFLDEIKNYIQVAEQIKYVEFD